jgi:hypothetical protein
MEQDIAEYPHHNPEHVAGKVPPFCRTVTEEKELQHFNSPANERSNDNDLENCADIKAVIMLVPDLAEEQQNSEHIKKAQVYHFIKTCKKKASALSAWHFYATKK